MNPKIEKIITEVIAGTKLTPEHILSKDRYGPIARRRRVAMYRAVKETGLSSAQIAKDFKRDSSTIRTVSKGVRKELEAMRRAGQ